jgi:hypothetical protein
MSVWRCVRGTCRVRPPCARQRMDTAARACGAANQACSVGRRLICVGVLAVFCTCCRACDPCVTHLHMPGEPCTPRVTRPPPGVITSTVAHMCRRAPAPSGTAGCCRLHHFLAPVRVQSV